MRLQAQGMGLEQYLMMTGRSQEQLVDELRESAELSVQGRPRPAGRGRRRGHRVHRRRARRRDRRAVAERVGEKPAKVREQLARNDQLPAVRSDITKRKALEWLLDHVEIVDENGNRSTAASTSPTTTTDERRHDDSEDDDERKRTANDPGAGRPAQRHRPQLPGAHGRRVHQPGRAGLRPLLPAAQGEHHLPGHAHRRQHRQPDLRPAAAPRVGEPRQGHQHLHQQPRRRHHRAVRHLRHAVVHQERDQHHLLRPGRVGRRRAAGRRRPRASASPCRTPASCSTSRGARAAARPPTSRSRPARSCG